MHACVCEGVRKNQPVSEQKSGPGSVTLIDLQVTGSVRGLIAILSASHLSSSSSSMHSLSFLSPARPLFFSPFCHPVKDQEQLLSLGSSCLLALLFYIHQTVKNRVSVFLRLRFARVCDIRWPCASGASAPKCGVLNGGLIYTVSVLMKY